MTSSIREFVCTVCDYHFFRHTNWDSPTQVYFHCLRCGDRAIKHTGKEEIAHESSNL